MEDNDCIAWSSDVGYVDVPGVPDVGAAPPDEAWALLERLTRVFPPGEVGSARWVHGQRHGHRLSFGCCSAD